MSNRQVRLDGKKGRGKGENLKKKREDTGTGSLNVGINWGD
jgi:hypothetical protein